jgi:hypothetical protein
MTTRRKTRPSDGLAYEFPSDARRARVRELIGLRLREVGKVLDAEDVEETLDKLSEDAISSSEVLNRLLSRRGTEFLVALGGRRLMPLYDLFFRVTGAAPAPGVRDTLKPGERKKVAAELRAGQEALERLSKVRDVQIDPARARFRAPFGMEWGEERLAATAKQLGELAAVVERTNLPERSGGRPSDFSPQEHAFVHECARLARSVEGRPMQGQLAVAFWIRFGRGISAERLGDLLK